MRPNISSHDQKFWTDFLTTYRNSPCLWKKHDVRYDKDVKNAAVQRLVEKWKKIDPKVNPKIVKRKIHSFRCAFQREHNKVISMKMLGKEYNPCLWYYDLLLFLTSGPNDESKDFSDNEISPETLLKSKRMEEITENVSTNPSYFEIAGMKYASDLASLDTEQRILAEKAVKDAIFDGKLGKLTENSSFQINKKPVEKNTSKKKSEEIYKKI